MPMSGVIQGGKVLLVSGRLRHRVQIVQPVRVQDSTGGWSVNSNAVVYSTWASIEALSATEKWAAHEFASVVTHKVIMRHPRSAISGVTSLDGIDSTMQVWFNTRQFQIMGKMLPDERWDAVVLMCAEIDSSLNQTPSPSEGTQ